MGSFLDRALCLEQHTCARGDDLLVLDRTTGLVQQYVFSFGNQYGVFDSRSQAFLREGILGMQQMQPVDASLFDLLAALPTGIHQEELYEARGEIMIPRKTVRNTSSKPGYVVQKKTCFFVLSQNRTLFSLLGFLPFSFCTICIFLFMN